MTNDVMDRIAVRKKNETASIDKLAGLATGDRPCGHRSQMPTPVSLSSSKLPWRHGRALVAIACGAIVLEAYVVAGGLVPSALNQLREVADNLGTTKRCGADVVDTCIGVGAALFAELEDVYEHRDEKAAA